MAEAQSQEGVGPVCSYSPVPLADSSLALIDQLGLPPFRQRLPWWGADLQTLRDTLRSARLPKHRVRPIEIPLEEGARLLAVLECPEPMEAKALVVLLHGLGGDSEGAGPLRLAAALRESGAAVLRLNMRGAGHGRSLAPGTYAAHCNRDLLPALRQARHLAASMGPSGQAVPLAGTGISLGGTMLLNACLEAPLLDALVCISSPLDLPTCSDQFEQPRNRIYQGWLVKRLIRQTLADPFGITNEERKALCGVDRPRTIRQFDAVITAPRWGFASVADYYTAASPLPALLEGASLPPTLLLHAADDPWVPAGPTLRLARALEEGRIPARHRASLQLLITSRGGHNGFHGRGDPRTGCWSDRLTTRWLARTLSG
jgi:predicted alpha/beta-fold hydrolase